MTKTEQIEAAHDDKVRSANAFSPAEAEAVAFRKAMLVYSQQILRMHFGAKLINKIFGKTTQSYSAGFLAIRHFEALEGRGPRPTLAMIQAEMGSPRTLSAFFALLRAVGFVKTETGVDARVRYLVPTRHLLWGLHIWMVHHLHCCQVLGLSREGTAEAFATQEALFPALIARTGPVLRFARAGMGSDNGYTWFDSFDCGDRIALALLRSHYSAEEEGADAPIWFEFSTPAIAKGLGVSRSHVRNIMNQAETRGLLSEDRATHRVCLAPRFIDDSRAWFTEFWQLTAKAAADAEDYVAAQGLDTRA